ncbi:MAG TPA: hypothetical protein VJN43_04750 [Bryobacteraceae bacterium]|nr:hypothetical protein [Bryobacteraceae bacterium]
MEQSLYALKTALRVLTAVTENTVPDPADVEALRFLAPLLADQPLEDLACDVVQQAITRRSQIRSQLAARSKESGRNAVS